MGMVAWGIALLGVGTLAHLGVHTEGDGKVFRV